jgi:hypothetical protein
MFGIQLYILIGAKRWGFHFVPFSWHLAFKVDPVWTVAMLGPLMFTAEELLTWE